MEDSDGDVSTRIPLAPPAPAGQSIVIHPRQRMVLTFMLLDSDTRAAVVPEQALLRLKGAESSIHVSASPRDGGMLVFSFSPTDALRHTGGSSGSFAADVLLGDAAEGQEVAIHWALADVILDKGSRSSQPGAASAPAPNAEDEPNEGGTEDLLPEIKHVMRPPAPRSSIIMSLLGTAAVTAPLLLFVYATMNVMGANFKVRLDEAASAPRRLIRGRRRCRSPQPPSSPLASMQTFPTDRRCVPAAVFHASLAALAVLYLAFWIRLRLVDVVPAALGFGGVAWIAGKCAF